MNQPTPPPDKPQGAETPRTDAEGIVADNNRAYVNIDFARQLERELTAATEALEKAKAELAAKHDYANALTGDLNACRYRLAGEREQSGKREAALREALEPAKEDIEWFCGQLNMNPRDNNAWKTIRAALSQQAPTNDTQ
jgi:hypothetical protein